ncbi:Reverse transcriptase, RNA-dependent DNA polymerase [Corchorus capsularis]|uniref:Reverse transcriptase, RNA-dependent DNA polymerase n=1 Tax=Corchorus capsularis TaxID=210143 RepID=A0A1R3H522_COCAP|nr:Reverse transcriptase, RNA-dependent DNA polymerase [Corchorus capsularis]
MEQFQTHLQIKCETRVRDEKVSKNKDAAESSKNKVLMNNKSDKTCFHYGKKGHFIKECWSSSKTNEANIVKDEYYVVVTEVNAVVATNSDFFIDSSATIHICNNKDLFNTYVEDESEVFMGNQVVVRVVGKGNVTLNFTSGQKLTLYHVPDVIRNLVSASLLAKHGFKILLESDKVVITKNGYAQNSKAYRLLDLEWNVIVESIHVEFFENMFVQDNAIHDGSIDRLLNTFEVLSVDVDPKTLKEALASRDAAFWQEAVNDEMDSIMANGTWVLVDLPPGSKPIKNKWVFRRKYNSDGSLQTFKARLVAKGVLEGYSDASWITKIGDNNSTSEAWEILQQEFNGDTKAREVKLQALRRDLENMKMKENETLKEFSSRFLELVNQMKAYGEELLDKKIVSRILNILLQKFDPIVAVIENTKDVESLSGQDLMGSLKSFEQRLLRHFEKSIESAFQSKVVFKSKSDDKRPSTSFQAKADSSRGGRTNRGRFRNSRGRGRGDFGRRPNLRKILV